MFEPEELMARIVDLEEQLKVSEIAPPAAEQLIACLEGEIAKRDARIVELQRYEHAFNEWHDKTEWVQAESATLSAKYLGCHRADVMRSLIDYLRAELAACRVTVENCDLFRARIVELESQYQRDVWGLNNECDPIGGEPAGGYANDNARLRAELSALKAQEPVAWVGTIEDGVPLLVVEPQNWKATPLYAAPVSEAKAQGVVMDGSQLAGLLEQVRLDDDEAKPHGIGAVYWNNAVIACQVAIRDALAAPVQQVSVPDGWRELAKRADDFLYSLPETDSVLRLRADLCTMLAASAAPAADAGLVEALDYQVLFDAIAAATSVYANGAINISVQAFRAALAAHRAKGVV